MVDFRTSKTTQVYIRGTKRLGNNKYVNLFTNTILGLTELISHPCDFDLRFNLFETRFTG